MKNEPFYNSKMVLVALLGTTLVLSLGFMIEPALAQAPLTPVIAVNPSPIDFGQIDVGVCHHAIVTLSNAFEDSLSLLNVTSISVSGEGLTVVDIPSLPFVVPGGNSEIQILLRSCPSDSGVATGQLTIIAQGAANSPYHVQITTSGQMAKHASDRFLVSFNPGAVIPPANPEGPLPSFGFTVPGLQQNLQQAGVVELSKLLPWFTEDDVHGTNEIGEETLLHDMSAVYVAHVTVESEIVSSIAQLRDGPGIERVEPVFTVKLHGTVPNDMLFDWSEPLRRGDQWGLHNDGDIPPSHVLSSMIVDVDVNAPEAWDIYTGGPNVRVAVLDTGVDLDHPDLVSRIMGGYNALEPGSPPDDLDAESHGTAVAGIISATGNNSIGLSGASWAPLIVPVRCLNTEDPNAIYLDDAIEGMDWARDNGIPIVNCSFGSSRSDLEGHDFMSYAAGNVARAGGFLVASMGNENQNIKRFPAAFDWSVFGVGALWFNGRRWSNSEVLGLQTSPEGSNYGDWIDACAPGGAAIVTTKRDGGYYDNQAANSNTPIGLVNGFRGSSSAAAFVSGVAALMKSYSTELIGEDFAYVLKYRAKDIITPYGIGEDIHTGAGVIRADRALEFISPHAYYPGPGYGLGGRKLEHAVITDLTIADEVVGDHTFIDVPGLPSRRHYGVIRYELHGEGVYTSPYTGAFLDSWWRTSGTIGWTQANPTNYSADPLAWAELYDNLHTYPEFKTFVYYVPGYGYYPGSPFPGEPNSARIAITFLGNVSVIGIADYGQGAVTSAMRVGANPSVNGASVLLDATRGGSAALRIYDVSGRLVSVAKQQLPGAGRHTISWDGNNRNGQRASSGVYFWELDVDGKRVQKDKIVLAR